MSKGIRNWTLSLGSGDIPNGGVNLTVWSQDSTVRQAPAEWIHVLGGAGATATVVDTADNEATLTVTADVDVWTGNWKKILACSDSVELGTGAAPAPSQGEPGPPGVWTSSVVSGPDGSIAWPNNGQPQYFICADQSWLKVGQAVLVTDGTNSGVLKVTAVASPSAEYITLENTWNDGPAGGTTIGGAPKVITISPTGPKGTAGTNGTNGANGYTTTTANFTQPAINATVNVAVSSSAMFKVDQYLHASGGGGFYQVTAIPDATHVTIKNLGKDTDNAAASATITSGAILSHSGPPGSLWVTEVTLSSGSFTLTDSRFTAGARVTLTNVDAGALGTLSYTRPGGSIQVKSNQGIAANAVIVTVWEW